MIKCEICDKEFNSKEALKMHNQVKHMSKGERERENVIKTKSKNNKKIVKYSAILLFSILFIYLIYFLVSNSYQESYTKGPVHWHATVRVFTCGIERELPKPSGEDELGSPLLHTHEDGLIHIEGKIWKKEDITLGKYFEVIGLRFTDEQILNYKNEDLCKNRNGKVKLFVDDQENFELNNYVIKDGDKYEIRFE